MRLRERDERPPFRVKYTELAKGGICKIIDIYPRFSEVFFDLEDRLEHNPEDEGVSVSLEKSELKNFFVHLTPPFRHAPSTRILYEVDSAKSLVTIWSVAKKHQ